MPELIPFPALRYSESAGNMSALIAPPYDVIDELGAVALRARSPYNCVRLILPEGPSAIRYRDAAETLRTWREQGILALDSAPSVYVYRQTFTTLGSAATRHALICALRLSPLDAGEVLPHERTHAGPRADRLALTLATRAQLSPVFMLARDPDLNLLDGLQKASARMPPSSATTPDGTRHELLVVTGDAAATLCTAAGSHPLLIADGHHRYETALTAAAELGDNVKAAFVLTCIVSQWDPGLVVQPTHRVLHRPPRQDSGFDWPRALESHFHLQALGTLTGEEAEAQAARAGGGALIVMPAHAEGRAWLATPAADGPAAVRPGVQHRRLAPVVFDDLVLRRMFATDADAAAHAGYLCYARSADAALEAAATGGCAFFLPPVALEDVWATAGAGGRLPQKSTYFEPKIPTGLVFRTL